MNTERTPEQIAAELFPYDKRTFKAIRFRERAAWLSRQPEVDDLKRQVEELEAHSEFAKLEVKELLDGNHKLREDVKQLAAKEKEVEEFKKACASYENACDSFEKAIAYWTDANKILEAENERLKQNRL
jgi:DNA repair ATPase RecN